MDELIADSQSILRLILSRGAMAAASRVCTEWAHDRRQQQLVQRRRILRLGASAALVSAIGAYFHTGTRWGGYRTRYRRSHQRNSRVVSRRPGPDAHRSITFRGFAKNQFDRWWYQVGELRRLTIKVSKIDRNHRITPPDFRSLSLPRIREPKKYLRLPFRTH
jgi:hypothetical protein